MSFPIPDTNQTTTFDNMVSLQTIPASSAAFYGQDAQYTIRSPQYINNNDGTITDVQTGLMWTKDPGSRVEYSTGVQNAAKCTTGGYTDWRCPTIKELYSLILFSGSDPSSNDTTYRKPFIDSSKFVFTYGSSPFREIDAQYITSTTYVDRLQSGMADYFGVNFADGRIKGYPYTSPFGLPSYYALYVRGSTGYGKNSFVDQNDQTILDQATQLVWMKDDSKSGMKWKEALAYCEALTLAGRTDWRLPNAKELQSIVDYTRSPGTTNSAAIDPLFISTSITNEAGKTDWPFYWTSTTHISGTDNGARAVYIAFGRAMGYMNGWMDVHGAGAQRSDPKVGDASSYPTGFGPQGDAIRINNYVRCVAGGNFTVSNRRIQLQTTNTVSVDSGVQSPMFLLTVFAIAGVPFVLGTIIFTYFWRLTRHSREIIDLVVVPDSVTCTSSEDSPL